MSIQIRVARARYSGDPGFLSGLATLVGGAATGFLSGGPLGAIRGAVTSISGARTAQVGGTKGLVAPIPGGSALPGTGVNVQLPSIGKEGVSMGGIQIGRYGGMGTAPSMPVTMAAGPNGKGCMSGHHINRSTYYTQRGKVEAGTACVKNRHMNPLNPRAASRAMRRLSGFSRAANSVEKMIVKLARRSAPRRSAGVARGRGKGKCGCR